MKKGRRDTRARREGWSRRLRFRPWAERVEDRQLLATFTVSNTSDSGAGSLRQAILNANATLGPDDIVFNIPASTAANLDVPVPGFDPVTQTWRIQLASALPAITDQVTIDGLTQAHGPVPFRYPAQLSSATQIVNLSGLPTGGTFALTTVAPLNVGTTAALPFNATGAVVQTELEAILGAGNVRVTGTADTMLIIDFTGTLTGRSVPLLVATNNLTGGTNPSVDVRTFNVGGVPLFDPRLITSTTNTLGAIRGNDSKVRVIVDGSATGGATGFTVNASHSKLRGMIITGFGVGVAIPNANTVGVLVQGNFIGGHLLYPVDSRSGDAIVGVGSQLFVTTGNSLQGVVLTSSNAKIGGVSAQESNVISGNGLQGILIQAPAIGNQVFNNQIGIIGPGAGGRFVVAPNGAEGLLLEATNGGVGEASSNAIGAANMGNLISGNLGAGVRLVGQASTRNRIEGNYIGAPPSGGLLLGQGRTGNQGDGIRIEGPNQTTIGGSATTGNLLSRNVGAGVFITGQSATGNVIAFNTIGLDAAAATVLPNSGEGVAIFSPGNTVGPSNTISANRRGVWLSGAGAAGNRVFNNRIGTDQAGRVDLGNAIEGVRIDAGASNNTISGDGQGSQVISGNNVGVAIVGAASTNNQVVGNFIGTDVGGAADLGNSLQGVLVDNAPGNTVGGTSAALGNLISANHWGVEVVGAGATGNRVQGNLIGTDRTGLLALGNELDGVLIRLGASGNTVGGSVSAGNRIAFNVSDGVRIQDDSLNNAILSNGVWANRGLGINLVPGTVPGPNRLQPAPTVLSVTSSAGGSTTIRGTLAGASSTPFTLEFFLNEALDNSGAAQGDAFFARTVVTTDAAGLATFSVTVPGAALLDWYLSATATDPAGNTSVFSNGSQVVAADPRFFVTNTRDSGPGSLRQAILDANANPGPDTVLFRINASNAPYLNVPVEGFDPITQTWTIQLLSALPAITDPINLDGYTQALSPVYYRYPAQGRTGDPRAIQSRPNSITSILGNDARPRVIIDGRLTSNAAGFVLDTHQSLLRGLVIANFQVGVRVADAGDAGNRIQGNFIGSYVLYPVDANSGDPVVGAGTQRFVSAGQRAQGVVVAGTNTFVGGLTAQEANVISGNGAQGVWVVPGAHGARIHGNQIGIVGPPGTGFFVIEPNQAEGVLLESSSNEVGAFGAGNLISGNMASGVRMRGAGSTRNVVLANAIGTGAGAGLRLGQGNVGNQGDGILIEDSSDNRVGGPDTLNFRNVISRNVGAGIRIVGANATRNAVLNNFIGLDETGGTVLGNSGAGVAVFGPGNTIGPGNVISANLRGVLLSGAAATGNQVLDNRIGTHRFGQVLLGNAFEGVRIDGAASGNLVAGNGQGSQLISGNNVGVAIIGSGTRDNRLLGNFIGVDITGAYDIGNALQGVLIDGAPANTIGGGNAAQRNLISANHWGVEIVNASATGNLVQGNLVGTDVTGARPVGNEVDGVLVRLGASGNTIGGTGPGAGNTIAFNVRDGVRIEDVSTGNAVLSSNIFRNGALGIHLVAGAPAPGPNRMAAAPTMTSVLSFLLFTRVEGALASMPNTRFTIQFFANSVSDPAEVSEGERFLGQTSATSDAFGNALFSTDLPGSLPVGQAITATATDPNGNTSRFSARLAELPGANQFVVTNTSDSGPGSLRQAILNANIHPGPDNIVFRMNASDSPSLDVPVPGFDPVTQLWTIQPLTALPVITDTVTIDGFTQAHAPLSYRYPGQPASEPAITIASRSNTAAALVGHRGVYRLVIDGSLTAGATGFVLDTSQSLIRGLMIQNFGVGVEVPNPSNVGNRVQGNVIGSYILDVVSPLTGLQPAGVAGLRFVAGRNQRQGVVVGGTNTSVGGDNPQENNVIAGNGSHGVWVKPGAQGNQVLGNQIGVVGPTLSGYFAFAPNSGDGVFIQSSSNAVGGAVTGAGNLIASNGGDGVRIVGVDATRNRVLGNYIGLAPGGGLLFGQGDSGNLGDGIRIIDAADNRIGGPGEVQRNVIAGNEGAGVRVFGATAQRNVLNNNFIGLDSRGATNVGNSQEGVALFAPGNTVGPINVISGNLRGVLISGVGAFGNRVSDNFIGTDLTGKADLGNVREGVRIENGSWGNVVSGDGLGSQVISGNQAGLTIQGAFSSGNQVFGTYIGTDVTGTGDLANSQQGIFLDGSSGNTIGGVKVEQRNLISANHWGVMIAGAMASGNLVRGNYIGTDRSGLKGLGNELDGVIIRDGARNNQVGGPATIPGAGNVIAFNVRNGVRVEDGSLGNAVLTNSITQNFGEGIEVVSPGMLFVSPTLTAVATSPALTRVMGTLNGLANTTHTVQFFANTLADDTGGQRFLGQTTVTTDALGVASFTADVPGLLLVGQVVTATATDGAGNTSPFAAGIVEDVGTVQFASTTYTVTQSGGRAVIIVRRGGGSGGHFKVDYVTSDGTALGNVNYTPTSGTLVFGLGENERTFEVPIINNALPGPAATVNLAISNPVSAATLGSPSQAVLTITSVAGAVSFKVTNTNDSGPGSLRAALENANGNPGPDVITFQINASNATNLNVPVTGFDTATQVWTIKPLSPLPTITQPVTIDGFSQGGPAVPYRYPSQISTTVQQVGVSGAPSGGTFTLTRPDTGQTTVPIPYNATAITLQSRVREIYGGDTGITVIGGPAPFNPFAVTFGGDVLGGRNVPTLQAASFLTGGTNPGVEVQTTTEGGIPISAPVLIASAVNTLAPNEGNSGRYRVVLDGSAAGDATGLVLMTSNSLVRGLIITGFSVGVFVSPGAVGNRIQGNVVGSYALPTVDTRTGLPSAGAVPRVLPGNRLQGVVIGGTNTVLGGSVFAESNIIASNGSDGVAILANAPGNRVLGNQVRGNQGAGVSALSSSNAIGAASGGNWVASNQRAGVHVRGVEATRNVIAANFIGTPVSGGVPSEAGNFGPGVWVEDASDNRVGGAEVGLRNIISNNGEDGVRITGALALRNVVTGNYIGLDTEGRTAFGNNEAGVAVFAPGNTIGPNNTIAANKRGVLLSGTNATNNRVLDNRIGTDPTGALALGNAFEGVRLEGGAVGNVLGGGGTGSQVISANNVGVAIVGSSTSGNQIVGTFIGTDAAGTGDLPNSLQGVLIDNAPGNTIGGANVAQRNLISANHWGVMIAGATASGNFVQGNYIGTDVTGTRPLGNEVDGVIIRDGASNNRTGGIGTAAGNTIAFNVHDGVRLEDNGTGNAVLTNSIFQNGGRGIDLFVRPGSSDRPNGLPNAPALTAIATSLAFTRIEGDLRGTPNTTFTIQFFANSRRGDSGGERFLGQTTATTDASGFVHFIGDVAGSVPEGQVAVATATDPNGNTSAFSLPIEETFGTVQFSAASYTFTESAGLATIEVRRAGGSGGYFTIDYATSDGTAKAGDKYTAVSGTLTFTPGVDVQRFTVPVINNTVPESNETVVLTLSDPQGAIGLGTPVTAVLTIADDDRPGLARFSASEFAVDADTGMATITVVRDAAGGRVSVEYATSDGTGHAGVNYRPTSGTLVFEPGQTSRSFKVPVLFDPRDKSTTTVELTLSNPKGGLGLANPSQATLMIAYVSSPRVTSLQTIAGGRGVAGVLVRFSEALDPVRAVDPRNYGYSVRTPGRDGRLGTSDDFLVGIRSITYDAAARAVRLMTSQSIARNLPIQVTINQVTNSPGAKVGVSNRNGKLLDGNNDGLPGGVYTGVTNGRVTSVVGGPRRLRTQARDGARR